MPRFIEWQCVCRECETRWVRFTSAQQDPDVVGDFCPFCRSEDFDARKVDADE